MSEPGETTADGGLLLRAGPLTMELIGPNLRWVRAGDVDLVQRVYVAVRDTSFNTLLPRTRLTALSVRQDSFDVTLHARHRDGDIDFAWRGHISGAPDGRVRYRFTGRAERRFEYNKIGLNIVHPLSSHAGRAVETSGGSDGPYRGTLPRLVGPQAIRDGVIVGIMPPFRHLTVHLASGQLDLAVEGDEFEMEDERNWTEMGYKSYSGPLRRPWPLTAEAGDGFEQALSIEYRGRTRPVKQPSPTLVVGTPTGDAVPRLGHTVPAGEPTPTRNELDLLRMARPSFVHADLRFDQMDEEHLDAVAVTAAALQRPLLASLYLATDGPGEVARFLRWRADHRLEVTGLVLLSRADASALGQAAGPDVIEAVLPVVRRALPDALVAVGSDRFLSEVIRSKPTTHGADGIAFGITPGGHTDEDWAIIDSLPAQRAAVRTLRAHLGEIPIVAGPVSLQTRFGSWPRVSFAPGQLPLDVDARQRSLLAAAWTLASVRELTVAGATMAIYYQTVGWKGLLEREAGCRMPRLFGSRPLETFPLLHLFADLGELRDREVVSVAPEGPVTGLAFSGEGGTAVLAASLSPQTIDVRIGPLPDREVRVRVLDRHTLASSRRRAAAFRSRTRPMAVLDGYLRLTLDRYASVRIDADER